EENGNISPAPPHLTCCGTALHQLYYDPNIENKNLAQKWLMQAQVSPQAWHFSWLLLNLDKVPEIQYFGASALHIKISRYWNDIPADQYESLKSQLFSQITRFASGSKIVLTRLCVALASLALSMMPEAWPCAVADMVRMFQAEDSNVDGRARCLALLELLTVLPEEFQTSRLPQYRKGQVRSVLAQECGSVFPLLEQLLQQQDSPGFIKQKVLKCFSSWVQLEIPLMDCENLIQAAFTSLQDPELFDTAVEAIVNAISQPDFINILLELWPPKLDTGFQQQSHPVPKTEVKLPLCSYSRFPFMHPRILLALLATASHCKLVFSSLSTMTPRSFSDGGLPGCQRDDILSFEPDKQAVYQQVYRPVYFQLVDVLLHKAQFPSDEEYGFWSSDEKEQFRIYRVDISDTLMYVYEMLGAELLSSLYDKLGRLLTSTEQPSSWQHTEALLYGFQSIAETIDVNYSDVVPGLIGLIPRISISNVQLADTVMFTIGALSEWLADHPVMINNVLPLVLQALGNPELSISSVSTLKKICRECKYDLPPYAANIVAVSQDVLMKQIHKTSQCMWLMQALGFLLSALQVEEILKNLHSLITPYIQQLEKLADETPNPSNKLAIIHILGLLSNLFTTLDISHHHDDHESTEVKKLPVPQGPNPVGGTLHVTHAPLLSLQSVCAIFEKSVKTLLDDFAPMVPQLCEMLGQMYSTIPQASALDLTRQLVHIFAHEPAHFPPIKALFLLVTSVTLTLFQQGTCPSSLPPAGGLLSLLVHGVFLVHTGAPEMGPLAGAASPALLCASQGVGGQASRSLMDHFAEILFALSKHCFSYLSVWMKEAMPQEGFPSARVSPEQKDTFSQQILRERVNKRRVKEMVKEFTLLCRGLHGTEYTADY
uniref:Importin-13 n=1 Tax=Chelydra serpentina TaxID=8475 RepID=A0A8C3T0D0_CHESE